MQILKHNTLMIVLFLCLFFSLSVKAAGAEVTYLGEFCFVAAPNPCPVGAPCPMVNIELGVLSYGDNHYVLHGTANFSPVYGTGFIQDNSVTSALNKTMLYAGENFFSAIYIVLDLDTWTGTFTEMPIFPVPGTSTTYPLTGVPCQ